MNPKKLETLSDDVKIITTGEIAECKNKTLAHGWWCTKIKESELQNTNSVKHKMAVLC